MTCDNLNQKHGDNRGSAIIIVVGLLAFLMLIGLHMAVSTQTLAQEARTCTVRSQLKYTAESAANRAFLFYLRDRRRNPNRSAGTHQQMADEADERWRADAATHEMTIDSRPVTVRLTDANVGIDVAGTDAPRNLKRYLTANEDVFEKVVEIERFVDIARDYIDGGNRDAVHLKGMERAQYEAIGLPHLPRNGPLQYRTEVLWMPGAPEMFPRIADIFVDDTAFLDGYFRLIPPRGLSFPHGGRPNFFASTNRWLQQHGDFSDAEMEQIITAKHEYRETNAALTAYLPPALLTRLRNLVSLQESGITTFTVTASSENRQIKRSLRLTRDCRSPAVVARGHRLFQNWEKIFP